MNTQDKLDADTQQAADPVAWMHPELHKGHPYPEECLSTEAIDGWLPLYTHPQPAQDAKDAARYRWLRSCGAAAEELAICTDYGWVTGSDFDETIDAAMKDTDHD